MIVANSPAHLAALLDRVRAGDEPALTELIQHYEPRLRTAAHVLLGPLLRPSMDSVDLVQSVHRVLLPGLREGKFDLSGQPFLKQLLVDDWQRVADAFQDFLVGSCLSSNMWLAASKR